jgi:hypothetical protein
LEIFVNGFSAVPTPSGYLFNEWAHSEAEWNGYSIVYETHDMEERLAKIEKDLQSVA